MDNIEKAYCKQLDENKILAGLVAGSLLASAGLGVFHRTHPAANASRESTGTIKSSVQQKSEFKTSIPQLAKSIQSKYKHVSDQDATHIASLAVKHAKPDFPKAHDILAISGIESSFNDKAKSGLKTDPARGLMQVRPAVWKLSTNDLNTREKQIQKGVEILHAYHKKLGNVDDAVHSYNVGLTAFKTKSRLNPGYVEKYKKDLELYKNPITPGN